MSADSAVTYTSVHSKARSWSIPSEDPFEEAAQQLLEAAMAQMRVAVPSTYHSLPPSGTPPLLPIPLLVPSTSRRAEIPEADTPPRKRLLLTFPRPGCEVRESSALARQPRPTMAHSKDRAAVRAEIEKMAPKRTTRSTQVPPVTPAPTATTTTITEAQLQALIDQGVAAAMAEAEASRVRNGYDSNGSGPRLAQDVRKCTYPNFLKCQPLNFKGTKGVVGHTQWFEKMESVFNISNCTAACQELALMCDRMFPEESDRVEKYISGLPDTIHDSVKATRPKTMQEVIEFSTELMDKRICDVVENKQKFEGTSGNNQNQPQQNKRQNTGWAYAAGNSDRNIYTGSKPLCSKCDYHHEGTPPLLPIPLPVPSTSRRAKILKADTPPRKRLLLTAPRPGCEVGESSATARQPRPTMARSKDRAAVRAEIEKMAPKRTTRSTQVPPVTPAPTATTITVTEEQLHALIDQGVAAAMAEAEASRVRNGYDNNGSAP
nr:reverse transcriptase domain-containing protein [Tanacetum cinerariifolium]